MIIAVGTFFWVLALAAVYRLLRIDAGQARFKWLEVAMLALCAALVLFRPHEDIFGGEDPGSYINSGVSYQRQKQLFFIDELLAKVPLEVRPDFYYGHAGYDATKDACLWIRNADLAMVGPHFQPAYPLLISVAARIGSSYWALFVVPLFTIFTALALRALALLTIPHRWAGLAAFLLYVFNPLTAWHGRCARPEIIASFMFFAGLSLTLHAWQNRSWEKKTDLIIGALCIGLAPLFHITAWALVIPAGLAVLAAVLKGRNDFLPYGLIAVLTAGVFYLETIHVTDYYTVRRFFEIIFSHPWLIATGFIMLAAISLVVKKSTMANKALDGSVQPSQLEALLRRSRPGTPRTTFLKPLSFSLCSGIFLGAIIIAFLAVLIFDRKIFGDLPVLGKPVQHYLYLTDFKVMANMLSLPNMVLFLAGFIIWLTGRTERRQWRILLALIFFPAIMLTGNISDFMMTRYLMVAIVPSVALCLAALIAFLTPRAAFWQVLILTAIICALGLNDRTHLIATVEHKGLCRFLRHYAEAIRTNRGTLLCEYSRVAAPMEHFFGIPTLGLDNERKSDYEKAEKAWAGVMKSMPDRDAFFMTPFHAPLSKYFDFEQVFSDSFEDCRLEQSRQSLPARIGRSKMTWRLFRMKLKQSVPSPECANFSALVIEPDAGNMGMRNFANVRLEPISNQENKMPDLSLLPEKSRKNAEALMDPASDGKSRGKIQARWARAHSELLLPASRKTPSLLMIHLRAPDPDNSGFVSLQLTRDGKNQDEKRKIKSEQWQWQIWQLPALASDDGNDTEWVGLNVEPAWNPGKPNFPSDLGVLISRIVCLPIE